MSDLGIGQTFYRGYRTVDQILQDMTTLAAQSPVATLVDYGDSYAKSVGGVTLPDGARCHGYDLLALKITNGAAAKPPLVVVAGMHAHEIMQAEIALRFARHLVYGYATDAAVQNVVNNRDIYIIPTANPDALFVVARDDSAPYIQRKNINPTNGTGAWPPELADHTGVDLNRNFSFKWGTAGGANTSSTPNAKNYQGPSSTSELEASALQTWLATILEDQRGALDTDAAPSDTEGLVVSLHQNAGSGNECCFPWAWTTTNGPNHAELSALATRLAAHMSYDVGQLADHIFVFSGGLEDYVYGVYGVPAILFESLLITGTTLTPYTNVAAQWPGHLAMLMDAAAVADLPYQV